MQKLKIAVLSMFNGWALRGVESWSLQMCHYLTKLGHECVLVQGGETMPDDVSFRTISVHYKRPDRSHLSYSDMSVATQLAHVETRFEMLEFARRCFDPLDEIRPDIILPANSTATIVAGIKLYTLLRQSRNRIVIRTPGGFNANLKAALKLGVHGVGASEPLIVQQIAACSSVAYKLIPNGVNIQRFEEAKPIDLGLKPPVVIATSSLVPYKRLHCAIEAVAKTEMSLLLIGDGPLKSELETLGETLLGKDRFQLRSAVPFKEIPAYYKAADVFTLPSDKSEAFGVVILEALAAGLPVVINDDPIRRWMVADNGLFVDPEDTDAYAAALKSAYAAGKAAEAPPTIGKFDWTVIAHEWSDFFELLVAFS